MLHHIYGPRVWSWFTDEAKAETSGWVYDKELGRVVSPDEGYTEEMLLDPDWDDESIEEREDEELSRPPSFKMNPKIILDTPAKSNHYNDNGTVKTYVTMFPKEKNDTKKKKDDDQESGHPPSAVSTEDDHTKEAPSSITDGSTNKMAMAKQFLAALEGDDDLKAMLRLALTSADPVDGSGAND